ATLRATPATVDARRWAGALIRKSTLENSASREGRLVIKARSASATTRPSTTPVLKTRAGFSLAYAVMIFAMATGSVSVYAKEVVPRSFWATGATGVP